MNANWRRTLIEALSVLILVAGIVALGIPKWIDLRRREDARRMLADVELVREAVYRFYSDSAVFPREAPEGQLSDELASYLPATFNRTRPYGTIEYRNWPLRPPPSPSDSIPAAAEAQTAVPAASNIIAIAIVPRDPKVAAAAAALAYETAQFTMGNKFFFVLFGS